MNRVENLGQVRKGRPIVGFVHLELSRDGASGKRGAETGKLGRETYGGSVNVTLHDLPPLV